MKLRKGINEHQLNGSQFAIVHGWDMISPGHWEHARQGEIYRHRCTMTADYWLWRAPGGYTQEFRSLRSAVRKIPYIMVEKGMQWPKP